MSAAGGYAVETSGLTRRFGSTVALDDVSLAVPRGTVFGLVGANGAGKTTLIKHVLGLLRAATGSVRVFDRDPVADPQGVLVHIGYLSEENDLPGWMRVDELLRYTRAFYPGWSDDYAEELRRAFGARIAGIVAEVTDNKRLTKAKRKALQVAHAARISREAKLVKLADKICNIRDVARRPPTSWDRKRQREYFDWAKQVIDRLRGVHPRLERAFDAAYAKRPRG